MKKIVLMLLVAVLGITFISCTTETPLPVKKEKITAIENHFTKPTEYSVIIREYNKDGFLSKVEIYVDNKLNYSLQYWFDDKGELEEKVEYLALSDFTIRTYKHKIGGDWYKQIKGNETLLENYQPKLERYWDYADYYISTKKRSEDTAEFKYNKEYSKYVKGHWTLCTVTEEQNRENTILKREVLEVW